jgi:hypothetical protein
MPPVHFALVILGILEMESHKLFAQAAFELQSSQSQFPKLLGLQATNTHLTLCSYNVGL